MIYDTEICNTISNKYTKFQFSPTNIFKVINDFLKEKWLHKNVS